MVCRISCNSKPSRPILLTHLISIMLRVINYIVPLASGAEVSRRSTHSLHYQFLVGLLNSLHQITHTTSDQNSRFHGETFSSECIWTHLYAFSSERLKSSQVILMVHLPECSLSVYFSTSFKFSYVSSFAFRGVF